LRILLDTNAFLYFALGSPKLSRRMRGLIEAQEDELLVSIVTPWEIAVKAGLGKLELPTGAEEFYRSSLQDIRASELALSRRHVLHVGRLPHFHRDPFDRLLVAQAQIENLPLATDDPDMLRYSVEVVW
jgi:PIN domain nuclease of toxin-antitoxin system